MKKFAFGCGGILLVLAFVAVVVAMAVAGKYNALVKLDQSVNQSWAQVQNVYQRRADLIPNLVNTVQGAANFEQSTLTAVTEARASVGRVQINANQAPASAQQLEEFQAAQGQLSNALSRLLVVAERSPELQANNTAVRTFPTNLFAGMLGFHPRPFFNAQPGAEKAPEVKFNFGSPAPAPAATAAA